MKNNLERIPILKILTPAKERFAGFTNVALCKDPNEYNMFMRIS